LAELIVQVEKKIHASVVPDWETSVASFLVHSRNRGLTEKTIHDYGVCLKAYTFEPWGARPVDSITTEEIRALMKATEGKSTSHRQNILKFIRAVFEYAIEIGHIQRNPTPRMKFQQGVKIKKVLTEEQARLLLKRAYELDSEWYPHWHLALATGMRNGELYALTKDKVNFETKQILVDSSWNNKDGFKCTKSGDDRIVPISEQLLIFMKELFLRTGDTHFVLPRIQKWDKGEQARELRMFLMSIGLPVVRFHDLRATWATLLLSKGVPAVQVMTIGGWKDYKTMVIYLRKAGVDIRGATEVLNLHDSTQVLGQVLEFGPRSNS
jgi:integrase